MLYESYVHPLTILSTLPSAGLGALATLMVFGFDFSLIALIGIILLIGIVKKNGIMLVDFAIEAQRDRGLAPVDAIREACLLRFRPIMMTTMAALLGGVPLMLGAGTGVGDPPAARLRHRRWADRQPGADPLHDAGRLSLPRPSERVVHRGRRSPPTVRGLLGESRIGKSHRLLRAASWSQFQKRPRWRRRTRGSPPTQPERAAAKGFVFGLVFHVKPRQSRRRSIHSPAMNELSRRTTSSWSAAAMPAVRRRRRRLGSARARCC